jgi:ATP-binding protein involved in chromosome partitioning
VNWISLSSICPLAQVDPSITIAQSIPAAVVLMVTTPQNVSLADVKQAISMFRKMDREILGIIENISFFCCEHSSEKIEIFGEGGDEALSSETGAPLLGVLPIDIDLRKGGISGIQLIVESPDSPTGSILREIATKVVNSSNN